MAFRSRGTALLKGFVSSSPAHLRAPAPASLRQSRIPTAAAAGTPKHHLSSPQASSHAAVSWSAGTSQIQRRLASGGAGRGDGGSSRAGTVDQEEVDKFGAIGEGWWEANGAQKPLHSFNRLRVDFLASMSKQHVVAPPPGAAGSALAGVRVVDMGCGGGILSEELCRIGAHVTGVDASPENEGETYTVVVCSEVIEHVSDVPEMVSQLCSLVEEGGGLCITTINRTHLSYGLGVLLAENILGLVPKGTHDWAKFVTPEELTRLLAANGFRVTRVIGAAYNPLIDSWSTTPDRSVNYLLFATREPPRA
ncbi:S-adenosyl-L-methionine-dependent methyltransferase [Baffinella frigidus]|nr:S-adenosyl-L-methionine-dependent methyltransferase [Cryptophyta sp. CCMP2293]